MEGRGKDRGEEEIERGSGMGSGVVFKRREIGGGKVRGVKREECWKEM